MPAQPILRGTEFRISNGVTGDQNAPALVALAGGGFVAVWESSAGDGSGYGVFGRLYDAAGLALTGDIDLAGPDSAGNQRMPVVTALQDGGFAVAWQTGGSDMSPGNRTDSWDIALRLFDADGLAQGDQQTANTAVTDNQRTPTITTLADGSIVVGWTSWQGVYVGWRADAQHFSETGAPLGGEVATSPSSWDVSDSRVIGLEGGNYVILWGGTGPDESYGQGVWGEVFAADGRATSGRFHVNTLTSVEQLHVCGTALPGGGFLAVWVNYNGWPGGISARFYDGAGVAQGDQFWITSRENPASFSPSATLLADGSVMVVWIEANADGDSYGIRGQRLDADGALIGTAFDVNTTTAGSQTAPSVIALDNGGFIVSWQSPGQDGDGMGIYAQVFAPQTFGTAGDDALTDTLGTNWIDGLAGNDTLLGGGLADMLFGGDGADLVNGGTGRDVIWLGAGDDTGLGGGHRDWMHGDLGNDSLAGGYGNDVQWGDSGDDLLQGNAGSDRIEGQQGADSLDGGQGNDLLAGGWSRDLLTGGDGADIFLFRARDRNSVYNFVDVITDFDAAVDRIDLRAVAAGLSFIGNAPLSGAGLEVRVTTNGVIWVDVDGDAGLDFVIRVQGDDVTEGVLLL